MQQLTQFMQTECGTAMTIRMDKADYLVKLTYLETGWVLSSVKIEIANPEGKIVSTMDNTKLQEEFPQVCSTILCDWSSRSRKTVN